MSPASVTFDNAEKIRKLKRIKNNQVKLKFDIGETVRISKAKHYFEKGYYPNYTDEIFTVHRRYKRSGFPLYTLKDYGSEVLEGAFYQQELQSVTRPEIWEVEKVIKTKGRGKQKEYYVKWHGYSSKFNSWVQNVYKNQTGPKFGL
jgi:hypothetical protein